MKTPQYVLDRMAGLTTEEHEYISIHGHRVALTAKQIERGWYTPLWRAKKLHADAWHAHKNLPAGTHSYDRQLAQQKVDEALEDLQRMYLLHYEYKRVLRCVDCNKKITEAPTVLDARTKPRCALCLSHFQRRTKYVNKVDKARSRALETAAARDKKRAKHCPNCHHLRPKESFLRFNDPFGRCEICRDADERKLMQARIEERRDREAKKFAEEAMERVRADDAARRKEQKNGDE